MQEGSKEAREMNGGYVSLECGVATVEKNGPV